MYTPTHPIAGDRVEAYTGQYTHAHITGTVSHTLDGGRWTAIYANGILYTVPTYRVAIIDRITFDRIHPSMTAQREGLQPDGSHVYGPESEAYDCDSGNL